jgi:hypothetical protein
MRECHLRSLENELSAPMTKNNFIRFLNSFDLYYKMVSNESISFDQKFDMPSWINGSDSNSIEQQRKQIIEL